MSNNPKSQDVGAVGPEFWHTYAHDDKDCPNTWDRELEEWQFDGVDSNGDSMPEAEKGAVHAATGQVSQSHNEPSHQAKGAADDCAGDAQHKTGTESSENLKSSENITEKNCKHSRCGTSMLSPMQQTLVKWLPAT